MAQVSIDNNNSVIAYKYINTGALSFLLCEVQYNGDLNKGDTINIDVGVASDVSAPCGAMTYSHSVEGGYKVESAISDWYNSEETPKVIYEGNGITVTSQYFADDSTLIYAYPTILKEYQHESLIWEMNYATEIFTAPRGGGYNFPAISLVPVFMCLYSTKQNKYASFKLMYETQSITGTTTVLAGTYSDSYPDYDTQQLKKMTYVIPSNGVMQYGTMINNGPNFYYGRYSPVSLAIDDFISDIPGKEDEPEPGDNTDPYGDKAGKTDGSKPIIGDTGDGDYDYSYKPVPIPDLPDPETSVIGSGFINIFHPTKTQIKNLGKFMYSKFLSLETIAKAYSNPMDYIQAMLMLPIPSDKIPDGSASRVYVANKDTGLDWKPITRQWVAMNCGTLTIKEPTKTYLDYGPYTKLSVYLPFIGIVDVDIDDFLDRRLITHTITVSYHIDLLTGSFLCYISRGDGAVMYTYSGSCASQLPLSQASYQNVYTDVIQMGLSLATGGAYRMLGKEVTNKAGRTYNTTANQQLQSTMDAGSSAADAVMSAKPDIVRTGNIQGSTGLLSIMYPYLIYSHPYGVWPDPVNKVDRYSLTGLPSGQLIKIASLKGFTQVEAVNLEVDGALADEVAEIERTLRDGVII